MVITAGLEKVLSLSVSYNETSVNRKQRCETSSSNADGEEFRAAETCLFKPRLFPQSHISLLPLNVLFEVLILV